MLAAFALRLYHLGAASLWYDETVSLFLAHKDLLALTRHTAGDIHPPLYYYLLHFWGRLAGWSEFSAAFLSLFFGVLLVALVYRVARDLTPPHPTPPQRGVRGEAVAFLAAFLVAISPYNLWYSQEVRMYTLGATLGLASVYFFVRMLTSGGWRVASDETAEVNHASRITHHVLRDFIAYAIVSALGLYTLYYFAFLLVFENLVAIAWLIQNSKLRITHYALRIWLASQLVLLLLYLPWLPVAYRQATDPPVPPWRSFTPLPNVLLESFSALALGQSVDPAVVWPMLLVVAAVIVFALWRDSKQAAGSKQQAVGNFVWSGFSFLAYTFVPLLAIYALSVWKPLYHVRYVFTYSPAFYILLALGLHRIANCELRIADYISRFTHHPSPSLRTGSSRLTPHVLRFTSYILLSLLTLTSTYSAYNFWFNPRYADDDLRGAVRYLAERWRPGDAVLINAGYTYTAFVYYHDQPIAWRGRITEYAIRNTYDGSVVLQTGSIGGSASLGWGSPESDFYATTADETRAALDRVFAAHPRVWMLRLYDTVVDPDGIIRDYLATRGRILDDEGFRGESFARVQGYLTTRVPLTALPASATRREVILGNRIALLGFEPTTAAVRAGVPLDVTLYWQARQATNVDTHLFVGLFAEDGKLVASSEEVPLGNALGTSRWSPGEIMREPVRLNVPTHVAPGNYVLRVAMYNPLTNEPLDAEKSEWIAENSQIKLTQVRVEK